MAESDPEPLSSLDPQTQGFLFPEDYTLFGLLVLHRLCEPSDFAALAMAQRQEPEPCRLLTILAEHNNLADQKRADISELLGLLATPKLRDVFPSELPAVATIREEMQTTIREQRLAARASLTAGPTIPAQPHLPSDAPTFVSAAPLSSQSSVSSSVASLSTRLSVDEMQRIERARPKGRLIGLELGGHVVLDRLGGGGQGDVYLAKQLTLNRYVAMKSLEIPKFAPREGFIAAFQHEAETLGRINHSRIVKVFDIFEANGEVLFTMEYIPGKTIQDLVKASNGPMPLDVVANLACQACSALQRTSEDGLIHRDIKPHNMLVDENGDLKIVDFGLAGAIAQFAEGLENFSGTPQYSSPEQASSQPLTAASDQYALGLTLYYALVGHPPIGGKSVAEVLYKQVNETPPPPSQGNNQLPAAVDRVIMRMLDKNPAKRFASFDECYAAWADILEQSAKGQRAAGTRQLLGEGLLRLSRSEKDTIKKRSIALVVGWLAFAGGAYFAEGPLRTAGMGRFLEWSGDWGTYILAFSLSCIAYVAMARRKWMPVIGSLRGWLYTHIVTAVPSILLLLIHSGAYLRGALPGGIQSKPWLSVIVALALLVAGISGTVGLLIFRALQRQQRMQVLELRGQEKGDEKENFLLATGARALSGWRLVHYPIALLFFLLAILHIIAALKFSL